MAFFGLLDQWRTREHESVREMRGSIDDKSVALWNNSLEAFQSQAKLNPKDASACEGKGWACSSLGRDSEAVDAYLRAVRLNPGRESIYSDLGLAYSRLKDLPNAVLSAARSNRRSDQGIEPISKNQTEQREVAFPSC